MADFTKMLQQAQAVQGRLQAMQEELEKRTVTASSGGGMVTATADGKGTIRALKIDPAVVDPKDIEMLEDLVVAAITEVQKKVAVVQQEEMQKATGGMNLPFKLPF
jgi:DNA-binding YbaB/EbfC family protein